MTRAPFCAVGLLVSLTLSAADPEALPGYPQSPPVRERVFTSDEHSGWTLRRGEAAVPLVVVPLPGRALVGLAGGWLVLGADLEVLPPSVDLLASDQPPGSPWAAAAGAAAVFVSGSPGDLVAFFPETGVLKRRPLGLSDLSHFAVSDDGFVLVQGRRVQVSPRWEASPQEQQPLPFFPADLTTASDGTPWASDGLQARPWRREEGFWKPLEVPVAPGRLTTLSPFPDSSGYFAGGAGWVGAFAADGTPFWVRDRDLNGRPLPRDLRVRAGAARLYLWSSQARRVWSWGWNPEGPAGTVGAPSAQDAAGLAQTESLRLEALGSVPEALSVASYGVELSRAWQRAQPLSAEASGAAEAFAARRAELRQRLVGAGRLNLTWRLTGQGAVADWAWEPDALWSEAAGWTYRARPVWEGLSFEREDGEFPVTAQARAVPGSQPARWGPRQLPSWVNLELLPEGGLSPVHWVRIDLPPPPAPYDLPVE